MTILFLEAHIERIFMEKLVKVVYYLIIPRSDIVGEQKSSHFMQ